MCGISMLAFARKSRTEQVVPELFQAMQGRFAGYYPGYSSAIGDGNNRLTWIILKAYTNNRAGEVILRTADPRDPRDQFSLFHRRGG